MHPRRSFRLLLQLSCQLSNFGNPLPFQDGMVMLLQLVVHFPEPRVGKDCLAVRKNVRETPACHVTSPTHAC